MRKDISTLISLIVVMTIVCVSFIGAYNRSHIESEEPVIEEDEGIVLHKPISSFDAFMQGDRKPSVEIIAHRGFSSVAPDNTLVAFSKALSSGCNQIELDVQMTKDGAIVVYHDMEMSYNTAKAGRISDYYYSEISETIVGSVSENDEYTEENIPRLQDVLDLVKDRNIKINLELKDIGENEIFVRRVVGLVMSNKMESQVIFSSFRYDYLEIIKSINEELKTEYVSNSGNPEELFKIYPADYYNLRFQNVTQSTVDMLHYYGAKVYVWTVNDVDTMHSAVDMHVDGVVTNCPDILAMVIASY